MDIDEHRPIPKELCRPAQGCEERATLGKGPREGDNPERVVVPPCRARMGTRAATTLSGLNAPRLCTPRVARPSQPWALGRNPFGILVRMPIAKDACKVLSTLALWILWRDELKKPEATAPTPSRWRVLVNAWLCRQVLECAQSSAALASVRWQALRVVLCLSLLVLPHLLSASESNSWSLASPGGQCEIKVSLSEHGILSYQVSHEGKTVLNKSPLGLRLSDQSFERALSFERTGETESKREKYELFAGTAPRVDHLLTHRTLVFRNSNKASMAIDLAASDEGVAFRCRFSKKSGDVGVVTGQSWRDLSRCASPRRGPDRASVRRSGLRSSMTDGFLRVVQSEATGFALPLNARGWLQPYHAAGPYTPAYEDFYFHVSPGDPPPDSRAKAVGWSFPALFHVPDAGTWALLTESGTDESYCACHLDPDSSGGLYRIAFPLANETTKGWTNKFGPEPRWTLPWTMPWRVIVLGNSAGDIAISTFVTDLAPASRIADTSWIKPGRASWAWWSYPDGPFTAERFNEFTDFAAKMGWESTLFDAAWWKPGLKK